jgi:phage shock protein A
MKYLSQLAQIDMQITEAQKIIAYGMMDMHQLDRLRGQLEHLKRTKRRLQKQIKRQYRGAFS